MPDLAGVSRPEQGISTAAGPNGLISPEALAAEQDFIGVKLAGLFSLASEIAEDLEIQEEQKRTRGAITRGGEYGVDVGLIDVGGMANPRAP